MSRAFNEYVARAELGSRVAVASFGHSTTLTMKLNWTTVTEEESRLDTDTEDRNRQDCMDNSTSFYGTSGSCIGDALSKSLEVDSSCIISF